MKATEGNLLMQNRRSHYWLAGLAALWLLLGACVMAAPATYPPTPTASEPTTTPVLPSPDPASVPPEPILTRIFRVLAADLGVEVANLTLRESQAVEWGDTGLGCPDPAVDYPQVITPGYRLIFADAANQTYLIHTNLDAAPILLCTDGQPRALGEPDAGLPIENGDGLTLEPELDEAAPAALVERARQALAQQLGVPIDQVVFVSSVYQDWSDSALGCPSPEGLYLQVITPGYLLTFQHGQATYDLRVARDGNALIRCTNGQPQSLSE